MFFDTIYTQYKKIEKSLMDEESRVIFDSRVEYLITRDVARLRNALYDEKKKYTCLSLDHLLNGKITPIVIFGTGENGQRTKSNLERCKKYVIQAYCDNNPNLVGKTVDGIPVCSPTSVVDDNSIIVIASRNFGKEMYEQLVELGVDKERIVSPVMGCLETQCGWQYFDLFKPQKREVFIDAGAYDGSTIIDFYSWTGERDRIAYGMEPVKEMRELALARLKENGIENVQICENAAWNQNEDILLNIDVNIDGKICGGSRESKNGSLKIKGRTIDSIISEELQEVTFIKMDIEGAELKALKGATNSILKYQPRMAISLYHKPEDVLQIPDYILQINPNYKLYLRHYTSGSEETVLYATL